MTLKVRVLVAVSTIAILLVVAAVAVTGTTEDYLVGQLDAQLLRFADRIVQPPLTPPADPPADPAVQAPRRAAIPENGSSFSTLYLGTFEAGALTTAVQPTRGMASAAVPDVSRATARRLAADDAYTSVGSTRDGTRYRITARHSSTGELVVLGVQQNDVDATVQRLITVEVLAGVLVGVTLALITWWVLRLGVRPVERMTSAAGEVASGDLDRRIPEAPSGTEAAALGDALNLMLGRIRGLLGEQAASERRLRQFLADASHELRTPVTTIRGYAELYRGGGLDDPAQRDAAMARTEAEAERLGRLVEDMTTLARLDDRRSRVRHEVAFDELVESAAADLRVSYPDRPVTVSLERALVLGDPDELHQVVANILENAVFHTPPRTPVMIVVDVEDDSVRLQVIDDGPGVSDETAARAFERFYRADASRSRASGGSGLGLSIAAAIVDAHDGSVRMYGRPVDGAHGPGTTVVVTLPALRLPARVDG